jgi:holliday junction DNA helicase RuvB
MSIQSSNTDDRLITSQHKDSDNGDLDITLRPKTLREFVGQTQLKANLEVSLKAAKKRNETLEHTLLYGPPGLGKTTLSSIIAIEMKANLKVTSAPAIEKQGDLAAILSNLKEGDVLFIDEIHRLKSNIEEILYSAMEDFALDIIIGKGPSARTMRINLPKFTLIGATTKYAMLSSPLRDRFGHIYKMEFYTEDEIQKIIYRSAKILNYTVDKEACIKLSSCCRRTPRVANRLLKRVRDFAEVHDHETINIEITDQALKALGIDKIGLDRNDREILLTIIEKFQGGPVGLNTLSAATSEDMGTIEDVYEPFLIQLGMLERKPRGRVATLNAYKHLGLESLETKTKQESLFS